MVVNEVSIASNEVSGTLAGQESVSGKVGGSYELSPALSAQQTVRGSLSRLKTMRGYSAFEVAVINGFRGTVDEWLESLKASGGSTARIGEVCLPASAWTSKGNLHSQVVDIDGVTERSQVDLTPSVEQLVIFYEKDLTFVTENDGGVVTVYAIGQKPTNDYTIQVTITEVSL